MTFTTSNPVINFNMAGSSSTSIMNISLRFRNIFRHLRRKKNAMWSHTSQAPHNQRVLTGTQMDKMINEIVQDQKTSLLMVRKVMKLLFDNICFDTSDTMIPLLPKIMNF